MNTIPENIIVNSCQYTPVYLIQNPGASQGNSFIITQNNVEEQKPVINSLKSFYESSGNIESGIVNVSSTKPRILKKPENFSIGNNLKLASFLLPKTENSIVNKQYIVNSIVVKPNVSHSSGTPVNTGPRFDIDSKIVQIKDVPNYVNKNRPDRVLPKTKPKEIISNQNPNPTKHTSVQLLKLGETYHSLNQLSDDQMKMVNQALKIFGEDPEKIAPEPTYDPVTNTRFIYKVVSPRDLTVVGKNKIREKKFLQKKIPEENKEEFRFPDFQDTVTRSGRKVKTPKPIVVEEATRARRERRPDPVTCFHCDTEFSCLFRLHKHYEQHPTHLPSKAHSDLFHCLLAIVRSGPPAHRTDIFIEQMELFIQKLKSLIPCFMRRSNGTPCTLNSDVAKLLDVRPGKYNIDINGLACVQDKGGSCRHSPTIINPTEKPAEIKKHTIDLKKQSLELKKTNIELIKQNPDLKKHLWIPINKQNIHTSKMPLKIGNTVQIPITLANAVPIKVADAGPMTAGSAVPVKIGNTVVPISIEQRVLPNDPRDSAVVRNGHTAPRVVNVGNTSKEYSFKTNEDTDSCARTTSADKSPSVKRRLFKMRQKRALDNAKRKKLNSESGNTIIELEGDFAFTEPTTPSDGAEISLNNDLANSNPIASSQGEKAINEQALKDDKLSRDQCDKPRNNHVQFYSAHFDIRSSPIKPSSAVFHKFQINPDKLPKFQIMKPLEAKEQDVIQNNSYCVQDTNCNNLMQVTDEAHTDVTSETIESALQTVLSEKANAGKEPFVLDRELKDWILNKSNDDKSQDAFIESNNLIEPSLIHVANVEKPTDDVAQSVQNNVMSDNHSESVLSFLETLGSELSFPETEIRNNDSSSNFELDLFSFHS